MAAIPEPLHTTAAAIYARHAARVAAEPPRTYLGGSAIGHPCARHLWLAFRGAQGKPIDGRIARLFDTGHREEVRLLAELREIGATVADRQPDGSQWAVSACGGHFRGHLDAVVLGLPEAPKTWQLVDVKSIKADKLKELQRVGLQKFEPKYHAQAIVYMGLAGLTRASFFFVCKDDDTIHLERIEFDQAEFDRLMARAESIIFAAEPPIRISDDADAFACRWCDFREICHGTAMPAATCRTCAHVTPERDGNARWSCARTGRDLDVPAQRAGGAGHRFIPILLERFAEPIDSDGDAVRYRNRIHGGEFVNGPRPGLSSREIAAATDKRALGEPGAAGAFIEQLRAEFGGEIVG